MDKIQQHFSTMKRLAQCFYFQPMTVINKARVFTVSLIPLNLISLKQTDNASDCSLIFYYTDRITFWIRTYILFLSILRYILSYIFPPPPPYISNSFLRKTCKSTSIGWWNFFPPISQKKKVKYHSLWKPITHGQALAPEEEHLTSG